MQPCCSRPAAQSEGVSLCPLIAQRDRPLVEAAVRRAGISGVDVALYNDFPIGAGLGGSSAAGVALVAGTQPLLGSSRWIPPSLPNEAARRKSRSSASPADARITMRRHSVARSRCASRIAAPTCEQIPLTRQAREELERRCIVVYTGESRISGDTITAVTGAYERRDAKVLFALRPHARRSPRIWRMRSSSSDIDALASLVGEHWAHQRSLHPAIPTTRIDAIIERARARGRARRESTRRVGRRMRAGDRASRSRARRRHGRRRHSVRLLPFSIAERGAETIEPVDGGNRASEHEHNEWRRGCADA